MGNHKRRKNDHKRNFRVLAYYFPKQTVFFPNYEIIKILKKLLL